MSELRYPNIDAERARKGLTVEEMCNQIGVKTAKTYNNWVRKGEIPAQKLIKLADFFGVTTDYLLGREE